MRYHLECSGCRAEYKSDSTFQICKKCDSLLNVVYDEKRKFAYTKDNSFWSYEEYMPDSDYRHVEAGSTGIVIAEEEGLYFKVETTNPTRSFKDRGSAIELNKAAEYGYKEVACASTGNMAYSVSHYAKLFGMKASIFISNKANKTKEKLIRNTGSAEIHEVEGDFTDAQYAAIAYSKENDVFLAGDYCYRKEGQKTIIFEAMHDIREIDLAIIPVGNATFLAGALGALKYMKKSNAIKKMPAVFGVEAEGAKPLYAAFSSGGKIIREKPDTIADAIAVGFPTFGEECVPMLKEVRGGMITVTDSEMREESKIFKEKYGITAELGGVASIAAYRKLPQRGKALAVVTGGNA